MKLYVVDAFTDQRFKGNAAAVVPVETWPSDSLMQDIAQENNLSETVFIKQLTSNNYEIRWFSPLTEIDFCGHATLAASFVLFEINGCEGQLSFTTQQVGVLTVLQREQGCIEMSFPNQLPELVDEIPRELSSGLSIQPVRVYKNRQAYVAVMASEQDVLEVTYRSEQLKQLAPLDVVVTAQAAQFDFVSRYFWPANGGDEDPVTGSIHAALAPLWAKQFDKQSLVAYQASARGGVLYCQIDGDRVLVSGHAVLYMQGDICGDESTGVCKV